MSDYFDKTLVGRLFALSRELPDKTALVFKKDGITYGELAGRIAAVSARLKECGVKKGDRVCISAVSKPESVVCYLATVYAGAIGCFLDKNSNARIMADICKDAGAALLVTDKPMKEFGEGLNVIPLHETYENAAGHVSADADGPAVAEGVSGTDALSDAVDKNSTGIDENDIAEILFTTGTTGKPKGVMLSYKAVYNILSNTITGADMKREDILLLPLPLNHSFALRVLRSALWQGATVVLQNGFTFAKEVENNIEAFGCTRMACVPASYEVMKGQMQDAFKRVLCVLKCIEFGAGSLTVRQRKEITDTLPDTRIINTWGSSETGGALFLDVTEAVKDETRIKALGKPLEGKVSVRILDEDGKEKESDSTHPGRMSIKGDMIMSGYWNDPVNTADTIRGDWLLTGDMAYVEDGFVYMLGRADDIINVGGEKVSPIEVENTAGQYEGIRECACISADDPDGVLGQIPVLFIVPDFGYDKDAFTRFLAARLEKYKIPKEIITLDAIPRNRMQKIDRRSLKNLYDDRDKLDLINPVIQAILSRRSIRSFTDREIGADVLEMILKAGYNAPSGHNLQSWRFTVIEDAARLEKLKALTEETAKANGVYFYGWNNPKVIVLISNDSRNVNGCQDSALAAENMMLAALSYGIGSVWLNPLMTLRDKEPVKGFLDEIKVPENHTVWCTLALGYPSSPGTRLAKNQDVINYVDR